MCFSGRPVDGGDDVDNVDDVDDIDNVDDGDDKVKIMSNVCIKAHLCSVCFSGRPHNVDDGVEMIRLIMLTMLLTVTMLMVEMEQYEACISPIQKVYFRRAVTSPASATLDTKATLRSSSADAPTNTRCCKTECKEQHQHIQMLTTITDGIYC